MFNEFMGLPAHALIVHAAVVFVPLQVLAAIVYAVVSASRRYIWWLVLGLAVVGPAAAWAARLSGDKYKEYWLGHGGSGEFIVNVTNHQSFGNNTSLLSTGLGLVMLAMVLFVMPRPRESASTPATTLPAVLGIATAVVVVALGLVTAYYVYKTGDSGARMVHPKIS